MLLGKKIKITTETVLALILLIHFSIFQLIFCKPNISTYINFNFSILVFIILSLALYDTKKEVIINISEKLIYVSLPLLIYEGYYRIANPITLTNFAEKGRKDLEFYYFKYNSIMYLDSNYVGLFTNSLFFFLLYLKQFTHKKYYFTLLLLSTLTFTTLSRASILSLTIFAFLYFIRDKIYNYRYVIFLLCIFLLTPLLSVLSKYSNIDDSFATKFKILYETWEYIRNIDLKTLFFGIGFGNTTQVLDIGAHNFISVYLIESGLVGFSLFILFWSYMLYRSDLKAGIVMFPFLFNSLSLTSGAIPYLYVIFAVILTLETKDKKNDR
ncbi:MAG: hypothetical protein QXN52_08715 [Nitrososphaerota archaeon]